MDEDINKQYSEYCAEIGHLTANIKLCESQINAALKKILELNIEANLRTKLRADMDAAQQKSKLEIIQENVATK